jgi:hypothetical protein
VCLTEETGCVKLPSQLSARSRAQRRLDLVIHAEHINLEPGARIKLCARW